MTTLGPFDETTDTPPPNADAMNEPEDRINFFTNWKWLYFAVIAYTVVLILLLYLLTISFDGSRQ